MQENYIVAYEYRNLKDLENKYATHDLELATIIHALNMWRHYLIGKRIYLMSDNISLKFVFDQKNMNARKSRWLDFLSKYEFEIKHIKGKENKVDDALSCHTNLVYMTASSSYEIDLEDKINTVVEKDEKYKKEKRKITKGEGGNEESDYRINRNGLIMCKNRLHMPNSSEIKLLIWNEIHKKPYSGHPSYLKMITILRNEFFWPNMKSQVVEYLARCLEYQQVKIEKKHPTCLLKTLPIM
jgi:hypothetical protein